MSDVNTKIALTEQFGQVIYRYSRAQAIEDNFLIDVSETAQEAGFRWPVAITRAAWDACVEWSDEDSKRQTYQDQSGRLWDVISMAMLAVCQAPGNISELRFNLCRVPRGGKATKARLTTLKLALSADDDGEPAFTIMLPIED